MPISAEDRRQFPWLSEREIAAIHAHDDELDQDAEQSYDDQLLEQMARVLRVYGYQGLLDYMDKAFGSHELAETDYLDILGYVEKLKYAETATLLSTILSATESSSSANLEAKNKQIQRIIEPLEKVKTDG